MDFSMLVGQAVLKMERGGSFSLGRQARALREKKSKRLTNWHLLCKADRQAGLLAERGYAEP